MDGSTNQSVYSINNTVGVSTVVYCGYSALSIPEVIITELKGRADKDGEIDMGDKKPGFAGKIGDRIKLKEVSPLSGLIWQIRGVDKSGRLMIELENSMGAGRITADPSLVGEILGDSTSRPIEPTGREEPIPANSGSLPGGDS